MPAINLNIREAARLLGGEVRGRNTVRCPSPGARKHSRSMAVTFNADGSFVAHSFSGFDWRECRDWVKDRLGLGDDDGSRIETPAIDVEPLLAKVENKRTALTVRANAVPIAGTLAQTYLASRGLSYAGNALRFHPKVAREREWLPAMVALMTDAITGAPTGIHRTYLRPDGTQIDKLMLGTAKGAVVRLSADEDVTTGLGIAEGIETGLACMAMGFAPLWVALSAGGIANFPMLPGIEALTVFADHDKAGVDAANNCAEPWHAAGCEVTIALPRNIGADFADGEAA